MTQSWSLHVALVRKKDGSWSFCVVYRRLNDLTEADAYPLPRINDNLDALSRSRYFSITKLPNCFETTDWNLFTDNSDIDDVVELVKDYIKCCEDTIISTKRLKRYVTAKLWLQSSVKDLIRRKHALLRYGDRGKTARYTASTEQRNKRSQT